MNVLFSHFWSVHLCFQTYVSFLSTLDLSLLLLPFFISFKIICSLHSYQIPIWFSNKLSFPRFALQGHRRKLHMLVWVNLLLQAFVHSSIRCLTQTMIISRSNKVSSTFVLMIKKHHNIKYASWTIKYQIIIITVCK